MSLAENVTPQGRGSSEAWPAIERLSVERLFGRYSYLGLLLGGSASPEGSVALLYGDNGSGKTTLLKLLYSCLSPAVNEGHRTYLSNTRFTSFKIEFQDGATIEVIKDHGQLLGSYVYRINRRGVSKEFRINTNKDNVVLKEEDNPDIPFLHSELGKLKIDLLFLQDDRSIKSTYEPFNKKRFAVLWRPNEVVFREAMAGIGRSYLDAAYADLEEGQLPEEHNLSRVIFSVCEWLKQSAFQKNSSGDEDASNVYLNVIDALAHSGRRSRENRASKSDLLNQLETLNQTADEYRRYGLVGTYPIKEFMRIVGDAPELRLEDIASLVTPYIDSVLSKLNAMAEVKSIMSTFEKELNSYLKDKRAEIHIQRGLQFFDDAESVLSPRELSTGERQLAFLFCAALLSRAGHTIFMIDEPELSLNVKWQRRLVSSLLNLGRGATTQFIMATHSIEIMAKHRNSFVPLG